MAAKVVGTYIPTDPMVGVEDLTTIGTTQLWPLGTVIKARDASSSTAYGDVEMMYLKGGTNVAARSVVSIASDWTTVLVAARAIGGVAVSIGAVDATTKYGWFVVKGKAAAASDTVSAGGACYIDGTAGRVDDAAVAGDQIHGMICATDSDTNTCVVTMTTYPAVADMDNSA